MASQLAMSTNYPINMPRRSRPRGLGYAGNTAQTLSGMGSWVVDTEYGLGPRFSSGHPQPYPSGAIPTRYPRARGARVMGVSNGANLVARPFAPTRLATTRSPVHQSPVIAPGAVLRNPGINGLGESQEFAVRLPNRTVYGGMAALFGLGVLAVYLKSRKKR